MTLKTIYIENLPCSIYTHLGALDSTYMENNINRVVEPLENNSSYTIYIGIDDHDEVELPTVIETIFEQQEHKNFILIAYKVNNWNDDLSPWTAPPVFGKVGFVGNGRQTLEWLTTVCKPYIEETYIPAVYQEADMHIMTLPSIIPVIGGYSLAGLFSLWAFYDSTEFYRVMSAYESIWFPNWHEYIEQKQAPKNSIVYLNLGDTEEKAKQPVMASVGDRTRELYDRLQKDESIRHIIFEWNRSGHFKDSGIRTRKGLAWILAQ